MFNDCILYYNNNDQLFSLALYNNKIQFLRILHIIIGTTYYRINILYFFCQLIFKKLNLNQ